MPRLPDAPDRPVPPMVADETARLLAGRFHGADDPAKDLRPIGPERLRALAEAIRNGTYPTDEHVVLGLRRMFADQPEPPPRAEE